MKTKLFYVLLLISLYGTAQTKISSDELNSLMGEWTGSLTYMDYSTNEPFSMPANVTVKPGKNDNQILLFHEYPNEPQANSKSKVTVSKEGSAINGNPLVSRENLENGSTQFTTETTGKDNNEKALIRNVYIVGEKRFVIRKEVKFESSEEWLIRNEFNYTRD
jgi:hypothetical protein